MVLYNKLDMLTLSVPIPDEEIKLTQIFIFTFLCGASKGFMKAFKALHKTFWGTTKKYENKNFG